VTFTYVAQQLHRDAGWSIADWMAAKDREALNRELGLAERPVEPARPTVPDLEPVEDDVPVVEPLEEPVPVAGGFGAPSDLAWRSQSARRSAVWWLDFRF